MGIIISTLVTLSQGIPGIVVTGIALILMLLALIRKDMGMMVLSALFAVPATYVSGAWAGLLLVVRLMPLFLLGSAFAISRDDVIFAWILPMPVLLFLIYFMFRIVASGFTGV